MKRKIKQVETHLGIGLNGSVTTCVDADKYGCVIDWAYGPKGDCIGFEVLHKGKMIGIPLGHVKQWLWVEDAEPLRSVKTT